MSDDHPLIKVDVFGGLSKPAMLLIEKVSDAIGGIARPYQIRRIARAEADAARIEATAEIDRTDLQRRALCRFIEEEAKKQDNIEQITEKAIPGLLDDSRPQDVDDDWITNFFDKCRLVSDSQMQALWAKVLSGECNSPGNFSKRTVNLLGSLDKTDAESFSQLCSFCWLVGRELTPLIYEVDGAIYERQGVSFSTLTHLNDIGLLRFESLSGFSVRWSGNVGLAVYHGCPVVLKYATQANNSLELGHVLLSKAGRELAAISGAGAVNGFFDQIVEKWRSLPNLAIEIPSLQNPPGGVSPSSVPADDLPQQGQH